MQRRDKGALRFGIAGAGPSPGVLPRCERARQGAEVVAIAARGPGTGGRVRPGSGAAPRPWQL